MECIDEWQDLTCPPPTFPRFTVELEDQDILWIDDPANATTVGPGGSLFGTITTADSVGWIIGGDRSCGLACIHPPTHPCSAEGNQYCNPDPLGTGCLWCGPGTGSDCAEFASVCLGEGPSTGDTSGGSADSSSGGAVDSSSGGEVELVPDVSMFTSRPDAEFGTTQRVLDLLGEYAPDNLSADDGCSNWDPRSAVEEWLGEPLLKKGMFNRVVTDAEAFLGYCDGLRLVMADNGVALKTAEPRTLAYELGFRAKDVIFSLNGVPCADALALRDEIIRLSLSSNATATIKFERAGVTRVKTIRIQ